MAKETWVEKARKKFQKKRYGQADSSDMSMSAEEKKRMSEAYSEANRKHMMEEEMRKAEADIKMKKLEKKLKGQKF
jgi:hypothetical protein